MTPFRLSRWPPVASRILIAWIAAWPKLTLILYLLTPVSTDWPLPLRSLASATGMVIAMNLVSVPLARRIFTRLAQEASTDVPRSDLRS